MAFESNNLVLPMPPKDKSELYIKLNFLTRMIDFFGINIFHILDENEEFSISTVIEQIMLRYPKLKEVGKSTDKQALAAW